MRFAEDLENALDNLQGSRNYRRLLRSLLKSIDECDPKIRDCYFDQPSPMPFSGIFLCRRRAVDPRSFGYRLLAPIFLSEMAVNSNIGHTPPERVS